MSYCSVYGCLNTSTYTLGKKKEGLTFHRFPVKPHRRQAWVKALGMEGFTPIDHSRVCSDHFDRDQFKPGCQVRLRLKEDALPNAWTLPIIIQREVLPKSDSSQSSLAQESRRLKALNEEKFMENFNPDTSVRETRKVNRKIYNHNSSSSSTSTSRKSATLYNRMGIHDSTGKDLCDCLDEDCPGCHFPCPKCSSEKCGHECRSNRKWTYENYTIDGFVVNGVTQTIGNPLVAKRY